jgi:tetratricopeptide (TPR) repeat protein
MSSVSLNVDEVIGSGENAYVILGELGRGASGVVYKARPVGRPDTLVALKLIEGFGNLDTQLVEPEILSQLNHPNIIRLVDYFLVSGKLALAMEFVEGPDLNGWVESHRRLSSAEVRDFLSQMAQALVCAHAQGVTHSDIKPGNIMVAAGADRPRFILADFGISRRAEGIQSKKRLAGSYRFMAPEQLRGRATPQSDLWSLGVVAYWLLTGNLPFNGGTLRELSDQISLTTPPAPSTVVGNVDGELETIVLELLQNNPLRRIDSASSLLVRLSEQPLPEAEARLASAGAVPAWELRLSRAAGRKKLLFWIALIIWMLPELVIGPALTSLGVYSLYLQQIRRRGAGFAVLGLLLILGGFAVSYAMEVAKLLVLTLVFTGSLTKKNIESISTFNILMIYIIGIIAALLAAYNFAKWRALERDRFFLRSLRTRGSDDQSLIAIFRDYLGQNSEELFVRQRLAELYSYAGRWKEAVVESKLILTIDPYNFSASLLLAEAYARLGLRQEAVAVCDGYLATSPQSFEFGDLRQRCLSPRAELVS